MAATMTHIDLSLFIISILGAVSNALLLVAFIKDPLKCFRNSGTYLVINLAVSDFLTSGFFSYPYIDPNEFLIFHFFLRWFVSVSFVSLTSISIDRFLLVAYPIEHRMLINGKVLVLWLAVIWMISSVIPASTMFSDVSDTNSRDAFFTFSVIFILLSFVMYSFTYYKLKRQSRNLALQNSTESRAQEMRILKEKRFLNTIVIIACIAFVCTVPSLIFFLFGKYMSIDFENPASVMALMLSLYIFQVSLAVNPLIYILRLPSYRKSFYSLYCRGRIASV